MTTFPIRQKFLDIARADVGKTERSKNQAPWIEKFWPATTYPDGMDNREPYCAAAMCYWLREWLKRKDVLTALKMTPAQAEAWRCQAASVFRDPSGNWMKWAKQRGLTILPPQCVLHTADIAVYNYSHIELVADDDGTPAGAFVAIGANTDAGGSRDGEGCFEKPRQRTKIKNFIRILA